MARVRLVDVAREAGVSVGAASDALAGKNQIPETTRQRVRDAAERLGYVPNPVARAMRKGRLPFVGLAIGALRRPDEYTAHRAYWGEIIGAATLAAADRGFGVVVLPGLTGSGFDPASLAGLAVISSAPDETDLAVALELGVPVVTDSTVDHPRAIVAHVPHDDSVALACGHLRERGARRPALLCAIVGSNFSISVEATYRRWCQAAGCDPFVIDAMGDVDDVTSAIDAALDDGVDAVYSVDGCVPLVLDVATRRGLEIGSDVLVVELDDDTDGGCTRRDISNVALSLTDFVATAMHALIDAADTPGTPRPELQCGVVLNARGSSRGRH